MKNPVNTPFNILEGGRGKGPVSVFISDLPSFPFSFPSCFVSFCFLSISFCPVLFRFLFSLGILPLFFLGGRGVAFQFSLSYYCITETLGSFLEVKPPRPLTPRPPVPSSRYFFFSSIQVYHLTFDLRPLYLLLLTYSPTYL